MLETCLAIKEQWNNKLSYTVESCWSFLKDLSSLILVYVITKSKRQGRVSVTELKQKFVRLFSLISVQMVQEAVFVRRALYPEYFPPF